MISRRRSRLRPSKPGVGVGNTCKAKGVSNWLRKVADPTGFEPAIFGLTGRYVRPLHHGSALEGYTPRSPGLAPRILRAPQPAVNEAGSAGRRTASLEASTDSVVAHGHGIAFHHYRCDTLTAGKLLQVRHCLGVQADVDLVELCALLYEIFLLGRGVRAIGVGVDCYGGRLLLGQLRSTFREFALFHSF